MEYLLIVFVGLLLLSFIFFSPVTGLAWLEGIPLERHSLGVAAAFYAFSLGAILLIRWFVLADNRSHHRKHRSGCLFWTIVMILELIIIQVIILLPLA